MPTEEYLRLGRREDYDPFKLDIEILALREGPEVYARVIRIDRDYQQFRKIIDLLPKKSGMSWEAPAIAMELVARIGSWPSFLIEIPSSLLRLYYLVQRPPKPRLTGDQIYYLEMKKQETMARRQKAMSEVMNSEFEDPMVRLRKLDNLIVTYCAPYYEDEPAFSKVMELWRDIVANMTALGTRKELCDRLLKFRVEFLANMIYMMSWRDRDIPRNNVYVYYNAPPGTEPPRYEYDVSG